MLGVTSGITPILLRCENVILAMQKKNDLISRYFMLKYLGRQNLTQKLQMVQPKKEMYPHR